MSTELNNHLETGERDNVIPAREFDDMCGYKNLSDFKNSRGDTLATQPGMYLCRCGGSASKPYCDGTHIKIGFIICIFFLLISQSFTIINYNLFKLIPTQKHFPTLIKLGNLFRN